MVGASRVLRVRTRARAASRSTEIYAEPADAFIAGFSGSPRTADEPANPALEGRTTEATSLGDGVRLLWRPGTRGIGLVFPLLLATVRVNSGATGALDAAAVKAITIPASTLTVVCTERPGRRRLQLAGFFGQCLAFLALGESGPMPLAKLASRGRESPHRIDDAHFEVLAEHQHVGPGVGSPGTAVVQSAVDPQGDGATVAEDVVAYPVVASASPARRRLGPGPVCDGRGTASGERACGRSAISERGANAAGILGEGRTDRSALDEVHFATMGRRLDQRAATRSDIDLR